MPTFTNFISPQKNRVGVGAEVLFSYLFASIFQIKYTLSVVGIEAKYECDFASMLENGTSNDVTILPEDGEIKANQQGCFNCQVKLLLLNFEQ